MRPSVRAGRPPMRVVKGGAWPGTIGADHGRRMYTITSDPRTGCIVTTFTDIVTLGERVRALDELSTHVGDPCRLLIDISGATLPMSDIVSLLEFCRRIVADDRLSLCRIAFVQDAFQFDPVQLSWRVEERTVEAFADGATAMEWLSA